MNKGISHTAEVFSTFKTKHSNIGLQSIENSNLRYRKNKQKKAYIEWRCFLDKSHNCKAKFFTSITLKECWNLQLDHICGTDLLGTQQTQGSNQMNKIKGKTPSQEKSKTVLGTKRLREIKEHLKPQINKQNIQRLSKHEKKHLNKLEKRHKDTDACEISEKASENSGIQGLEETQKHAQKGGYNKDMNASGKQILTQNSSQSARPQLCPPLIAQCPDAHNEKQGFNATNNKELGDDQSRSDFINFPKYSNQIQTDIKRLTQAQNLTQSQQPTRESSNTDVMNSSGQSTSQQATTDHNQERTFKFEDNNDNLSNLALNKQYLITPDIRNDLTTRLALNFSGQLEQPINKPTMEYKHLAIEIPKRETMISVQNQDDDYLMNELSIDDFLKRDVSSSDPSYESCDYGQSHNFWNTANEEEYAIFLREDANYDFIEKKSQ